MKSQRNEYSLVGSCSVHPTHLTTIGPRCSPVHRDTAHIVAYLDDGLMKCEFACVIGELSQALNSSGSMTTRYMVQHLEAKIDCLKSPVRFDGFHHPRVRFRRRASCDLSLCGPSGHSGRSVFVKSRNRAIPASLHEQSKPPELPHRQLIFDGLPSLTRCF